ncbi:MAG: helix-turn-helix domain-containing protein [Vicinamibacterales bacterium]
MDVRDALLKAALKAFADAGTRGATTRRIAQDAGVNEVTLFRHFQSKDDLMRAALEHFAGQAFGRRLPDDPVDPRAELLTWCQEHHRALHRARALIRRSMGEYAERPESCSQGLQVSVRIAHELSAYLRELKRRGLAREGWDERAAAAMLMGALFTDAMGRDTMPERYPYSMRDAVEQYVDLFLHALGVPAAPAAPAADR